MYTDDEFATLVERETNKIELKSGASGKKLQEAFVAMSNTDGGTVFIGVTDERTVIGKRLDQGTDDAIHQAAQDARDLGPYTVREVKVGDRTVVAIDVAQRIDTVSQTSDGRVLVRRGARNVALFGRELFELMSIRTHTPYERTPLPVPLSSIDSGVLRSVVDSYGWPSTAWEPHAKTRGLLTSDGHSLTVAGALVLTSPDLSLDASKFHIDIRSYTRDQGTSYVRREVVTGTLQHQVETATEYVLREIGTELVVTGSRRHDLSRIPSRVVRETVANAAAHRDYSIDAMPIVIEVRPSFVSVASPGSLPDPVTVESLREAQSARNHAVIDVLRRFGLAEDSGQGIDVMQDDMRLELLDEPVFRETRDSFIVTLRLSGQVSATERAWLAEHEHRGDLDRQDRSLLVETLRNDHINNGVARAILDIDSTEARARLRRLRDLGLLEQHGARGGAYYTLGILGPERSTQQIVLDAARDEPLTNQRVRELTGIDRGEALSLLRRLVREGRLRQEGQRRGTRYTLPTDR